MRHQKEDLQFGNESEQRNLEAFSTLVGASLQKTAHHYHPFDFTNDANTIFVELKSRRVESKKYPTALIGKNKIEFCSDLSKAYYFCFAYTDGLYYIQYDKKLFDTFRVEEQYYRSPRYGCINRPQTLVHIPSNLLLPLNTNGPTL